MTEDSAVKVCVRVRPLVEREENAAAENAQLYWKADNNSVHHVDGASVKSFSFDHVFTAYETTNQLYQTIAKPLVVSTVKGYNGTIFAYGQTSSGKTFSMMGCDKKPGVIPLAVEDIFQTIQSCSTKEYLLRVSYMEIYNETVSDLLVDSWKRKPLEVRETLNKNIYVADLSEELVTSTAQALHWIRFGEKNRHYGKTKMNERSSRSHTIFRMILESREKSDSENSDGAIIVSHLNLVDLAGSERASQTGAEGARFKEGCNINKSLFTLGQVIKKLTDESHKGYTSYRDSKLTRILQNSLGGNAKTVIICTITPAAFDETLSTLQFASTAKKMKNDPHVTEVSDDGALLKRYRNEIVDLKRRLQEVSSVTQSTATEKELLSQLQEKDQLQREQEDRIRNLTNLLVSSNPNPAPVRQALKRRVTWGGKIDKLAATSSASSKDVLAGMSKRRRANISCIEPLDEQFYPPWDAFDELPEDMDATQTSVATRSFGDSPKDSEAGEKLRDMSEKMSVLEQQLESECSEKSEAESKAKALADRVAELEQQLEQEVQLRENASQQLTEAQQREAELDVELRTQTEQRLEQDEKMTTLQSRVADVEAEAEDGDQMRRQFSEAIQLCESLSSEKDLLLVERDYLKEELGLSLEQIQTLEKEKTDLYKKLSEKQEMDEFEMLEARVQKDDELEQREEISQLKTVIESTEQKCQELQNEIKTLALELQKKHDFIEELQAMNGKDLVQEVTLLQRSLGDAEKISMDTKKDWACLRSQNMDLKEKNETLSLNWESHEKELSSLQSQLEREKSKFKKMQFDLQKELNIAFEENVKLGSLLDGKVPKNLIDNVDLERTVTKLNKDLAASQEKNTELQAQLEEVQQLPDKLAELTGQLEESECARVSLTEELHEIHTLKRELEERISNCEETRKTDEEIHKELEKQLEQATAELQNAQATNEAAMMESENRLQSLCEEKDVLQQRLEQVVKAESLVLSLQEQLDEEKQKLSSEEALHQQRVSELNLQMNTVSQELVTLQQEKDESISSLGVLTEERDQLKADLQENIEMMIELQDELRTTQEKIRSQKHYIQKLEAQTAEGSSSDQPGKHEAQIRILEEELQHLQEYKQSSSEELQKLESKVTGLSENKDLLQQTLTALTEEKQQLQQLLDSSTDSLQTEITELKESLHMVSEQKRSLEEQQHNNLETELLVSVQEELSEQKRINARLCEEHSVLNQQVQSQSEHLQRVETDSSSEEMQKLESRVRGLTEDKDQLQQTLAALTEEKQQLQLLLDSSTDSLQTEITGLKESLHMVSEQRKRLEEQLNNNLETITELKESLHMVSEQKRSLQEQQHNNLEMELLVSVQEELSEQKRINARLCEEHSVLNQQVQSQSEQLQRVEADCSSEEMQKLESRVRGLTEDKDQLQQTLAALTEEKQQLQQLLDSSTDSLQTEITELKESLNMVSEQKRSLEEQQHNNLEMVSQKQDLLSSVQEELSEQKMINAEMSEENILLNRQVQSQSEQLQRVEADCSSEEMQKLESRVRGLTEDKDQLQQTLAALTEEKQQLQQLLDSSTDSLQTEITELKESLHMVSEQKRSLEEQQHNNLEMSSQKEELYSSVQEKLNEQERINARMSEEHALLDQQAEALTKEVELLKKKETEVPVLQQALSNANQTISKLRAQLPSEGNPKDQLSLLLDHSTKHFQKSLEELKFMAERRMVPLKRKIVLFTAPSGFSSLPENTVDSFKAVNFVTVRALNAIMTIEDQSVKYAQSYMRLFEELVKNDLAVFEERRLQDILLCTTQAPSFSIRDMDFMSLWKKRLQEVVAKRERYFMTMDSTLKKVYGFYTSLFEAEFQGKDRFETQLSEMCGKEPVDLSALDVFFGTEQQQRNDVIQERDAIFKDLSKDHDASLKELSEQVAQEKALLEDERSKRFTLQHGLEAAPLKSEASLLNDNQRLLHQLHTTEDILKILSTEKEELQKAQVKAEHLVASHKEATQLLQTELQDTCAKLQEKELTVEELQTSLQQSLSEWNSSAKAVELDKLNHKVSKLEAASQNYKHEIQKLTSVLEYKETTLRKLKETLRSQQRTDESILEGEALHARLVQPKGLVQSSVILEKSRLDEEAKQLKLRITELESLVTSLQAEVGKWKQRALKMKSATEAKTKQEPEASSQKLLRFDSPRKLPGSPRKALDSPARLNSPKSLIFDNGNHAEFLFKKCPKQFFDNSNLGAAPVAECNAEKEDWLQWPSSPKEEDMCKKQ